MYLRVGIRSVTMDDVATELGISKKTLYQFFKDKKDMVTQVVDHFLNDPAMDIRTFTQGNAIDNIFAIRQHVAHILKFYNNSIEYDLKKYFPDLYTKVRDVKHKRIFEHTIDNLNKGIKEGLYRKDLDPYFIAKLQVGRMLYTLNPVYGIFEEYEVLSLGIFDSMTTYHMQAICSPKGLDYYKKQLNKVQNETKN